VNTAPYGENTTINVTGPAGVNVTVYVDDVPYNVTINENGTGILKLDNITAGHHTITANFTGDDNYTTKEVSKPIDIVQQTPDIQIIVPQTPVSPNSTTNVTVIVGKNATGRITIKINDNITTVDVINGTAVLPIKNIQPGTYNVTAEFYGDGNYKGSSNTTGTLFTVDKYEASITEVTPVVNDDNTVTVTVKLNETATGNVTIEVEGTNYTAKVIKGVATVEINKQLANKTYDDLVAVYSGDENYKNTTVNVPSFDVTVLRNFNVTVDITEGKYGENTTITVKVPAGSNGNVSVIIDGEPYPAKINPDGTATIQVPLGVGNHTIKAVFENSTGYAAKNSTEYKVNIEPQDTYPFNVTVKPAPFGNNTEITVNGPAGLKVNVTVDGEVHTLTIGDNGTVKLTLDNLTAGKHDVSIKSEANGNYTANVNSTTFEIPKQTPEMDITISEGRTPNENVTVTVKVGDNATGVVSVTVDGKLYDNVEVKDGVAQFNVTGLMPNEHTIDVKYLGDDNYNASDVVSEDIKMDKYASTVEVRNWERDEDNNVIVSVYVSGDDGNVTIKVGDKTYNATVNDGVALVNMGNLQVEDTIINVSYTGDENYTSANITDVNIPALKIVSYPLPLEVKNITYGGDAIVKVTLPEDWSVDLRLLGIKVDGDYVNTSDYHVDGNVVTVTIKNPKAGEHAVEVYYEDGKYDMLKNGTSFTVEKAPIESSNITVSDPIEVGQPLNVTVDLPKDANGTITVDVNGTKYVFDVVNGSANISIPKLGNGTYKVNVTYSGDDNYDPISIAKEVTVNKVDPEIKAETSEIKLGEPAIIDVTLPDDATGTVTIKVGNVEKTVPVAGGLNHISVENIPVGENQTVIVTYNGNDKYAKDTITTNLTVKPQDKTSDEFKVDDKGNGTIIVTVPENATGNITLKIGNETYEVPIEDGKAVIDIANRTNQTPGVHDVTISYTGDGNNTPVEFNSTANVPKWESEVNVNIPTIREGDIAKVNVTVTSKDNRGYVPNGTVRVEVDGKGYFGELINGNVIVDVPGLGNGTHTVKVTYDGNDYYLSNSTTETVTVQEAITVKVNGTGNSSEIVVKLPEDATQDQVEVFIDGKNETDRLTLGENGTAKVNLTGIEPGVHNVTIKYTDEDGTVSYVNTTVNVPKWSSSVNATAATIREGDPAIIKVTVGKDMTGEVKVVINGTGYIADVDENGEATITAYGLKAGNHTAVVTYLGSDKYEPSNATFKLTVQAPITVEVNGTGNGSEVVVKFPEGTTKDQVNVTIDGKDANDRLTIDENGTAKINLTGIEPGEHNITIKYTDEDGTVSWVNTTVNVPKWSSSVNATAAKIREGDPAVIKVKVSPDMQGEVKVVINGTGYIATVDENGEATITAYGLKAGNH
ncbi:MAG: Ig-like domain-containing protein, partial [Methanobrevibacter sp.]|nr:Ig-like domain-containing protein [Methanobrevibacter sp.]